MHTIAVTAPRSIVRCSPGSWRAAALALCLGVAALLASACGNAPTPSGGGGASGQGSPGGSGGSGGSSGTACDFLTTCIQTTSTLHAADGEDPCPVSQSVSILYTNHCGEAVYCELGALTAPLPLGSPVQGPGVWRGTIASEGATGVTACDGFAQPAFRCVRQSEATACMGAPSASPQDAGGAAPACSCKSPQAPVCPDPNPNPNAFCCPAGAPYSCGEYCSAAQMCCDTNPCICTQTCAGGGGA